MKWVFREITVADMVRVPMDGGMHHYGICTGEDRIIQFGAAIVGNSTPREQICVMAVTAEEFLSGHMAEVASLSPTEKREMRRPDEVVAYAESRLGERGYDILYNNCEHFAYECIFGRHYSSQVDDVRREMEQRLPPIFIHTAPIELYKDTELIPSYVKVELEGISSKDVADAKRAGFGLLVRGYERWRGELPPLEGFYLAENGKPCHSDLHFSISHSGELVSVALSTIPVGIDIEQELEGERAERISRHILCPCESADTDTTLLWTCKEAVFKARGTGDFVPRETDTVANPCKSAEVFYHGKRYVISVRGENMINVKWRNELYPDIEYKTI